MLIARYSPLPEPATNIEYSYVQDVYVSDIGCQLVIKVNLKENSCFPFGYCLLYHTIFLVSKCLITGGLDATVVQGAFVSHHQ